MLHATPRTWSDTDGAKRDVVAAVKGYLPADELQFLMELSVEPVAAKLGLLEHVHSAGDGSRQRS